MFERLDAEFTLEVGGRAYRLGTTDEVWRNYVRVAEQEVTPGDLALVVDLEGVVQRVSGTGERDPGGAADLYDAEPTKRVNCAEGWTAEPGGLPVDMECSVSAGNLPYLHEHGWATDRGEGLTWVVVRVGTTFGRAEIAGPEGVEDCVPWSVGEVGITLDGASPDVEFHDVRGKGVMGWVVAQSVAFLAPRAAEGILSVTREEHCRLGPGQADLVLRKDIPLGSED